MTDETKSKKELEKLRKKLEEKYKNYIKKYPKDIDIICDFIDFYLDSDAEIEWQKALNLLSKHKDEFEHESEIHRLATILYMRFEDLDRAKLLALDSAEKYGELDPENPKALLYVGYVFWWYNEVERAIEKTKVALELATIQENKKIQVYSKANLAYYYANLEKWEEAETALQYAHEAYDFEKSPARVDTLGYVIMKFAKTKKDLEEAENKFKEALNMKGVRREYVLQNLSELQKKQEEL
jgi:tetratricopeptide (TPR) repeat protein